MRRHAALAAFAILAGCAGRQSVLDPAGRDAEILADLFWVMLGCAIVLWCAMNGLFLFVTRLSPREISPRYAEILIVGGGIALPTVLLAILLSYGLAIMPGARAASDGLTVRVVGEQWWWRVEYLPEDGGPPVVSANEVRLPAGRRSDILLSSDTVIHSFWVPALGGKMDMFPGRETRMSLEPVVPGLYRGQCAEFCGESHALMAFETEVLAPEDFAAWLEHEASEAEPPEGEAALRGAALFAEQGCGACHTVRGTPARGNVGPDLTHVGSRHSIGAGVLPNEPEAFARWVGHTASVKPGVEMPSYDHLPPEDLAAIGAYLEGLQ